MQQRSQFLAKTLATAQLEKSDNRNEQCDLRPTEIQRSKKYAESFVVVFGNLLNTLDGKVKEAIYYISSGLSATLENKENLLKSGICSKEMRDTFIRERLATRLNFFESTKSSKLKTFESATKKIMVKT